MNRLLADDSHEISYLIFVENSKKISQNLSSAAVVIGTLKVNSAFWILWHAFLPSADFFFKINFFKKSFRNTIKVSNSLDLGPNCLQRLSADDTSK